jgi:outer membrane protein TolC
MRNLGALIALMLLPCMLRAQADMLSLEECYELAQQHYPLIKQKALIAKSRDYSVKNAAKGYLPQLNINGQATYQSEVTRLPIDLPAMEIEPLSKDQYRLAGELTQTLFDGGMIMQQQQLYEANAVAEEQKVVVELHKLKERIDQLFFGALLVEEQLRQSDLLKNNIEIGLDKVKAAIANGTAFKSSAQVLEADLLQAKQRTIELQETKEAYLSMLGQFINQPLGKGTKLAKPEASALSENIQRPELQLFDYQKRTLLIQDKLISARNLPKAGLFLKGGYGRPGLNMLSNEFDFYYIGGLRINWSLSGFYTSRNERQLLETRRDMIDVQQETFLFNTSLALRQQLSEIHKLQKIIQTDEEIIALRSSIMSTAKVQLENGAITVRDYLRELNAEDQARQNLLLHQVQLQMAQNSYNTISGN